MPVAPSSAQALIDIETRYGSHNYHPLDVVCERGEGVFLWDVEGKRYMDFLASYSAVNQGHNHPRIAEALIAQARKLALTSRAFRNDRLPGFLEKLCRLTGFDKALPMNSGAEAVETAIKASRKWGYDVKGIPYPEAEIVVAEGNFHGRTTTIVGFSTDPDATSRFGPFAPGFRIVPYGDVEAARAAITPRTCAVLVEPIQGEGGVIIPPKGYLKGLRRDLRRRTGSCSSSTRSSPASAAPASSSPSSTRASGRTASRSARRSRAASTPSRAFLARAEVMDVFTPGIHGSTFGGNPLACAVGIAALDVLIEEKLIERAAELGPTSTRGSGRSARRSSRRRAASASGPASSSCPEAGGARKYCYALKDRGLLCKDTHVNTIRLAPPLVITREQLDWAVDQIEAVLAA